MLNFLKGKKTYLVALAAAAAAAAAALGHPVPEWVWPLLGAAGLGSVRAAVGR